MFKVKNSLLGLLILVAVLVLAAMKSGGKFEKIQMDMNVRTAHSGKMTQSSAQLHYLADGRMIANFILPSGYTVINNTKGEVKVYDPVKNTIRQVNDYNLSTESSLISFFVGGQVYDMGLGKMGFVLLKTERKDKLNITSWSAPESMASSLSAVKLVLDDNKPIYIEYMDNKKKVSSKTYFYKYETYENLRFPTAVTVISYLSAKDSMISKTTFTNVKLNAKADSKYFNFTIPANAKLAK